MKIHLQPPQEEWSNILQRPSLDHAQLEETVASVLQDIKARGDLAVLDYTEKFDRLRPDTMLVSEQEIKAADQSLSPSLKQAIQQAAKNIECFHASQQMEVKVVETMPGVKCWRKSVGIEKVGLYIPGGTAPLFSTVLMLGIPARLAGCQEVVLCSPPTYQGGIHPAIIYTANLVGISKIFKVGGVQAIGAMAYGTETIPQVYKIFGPGNQYVTAAKQLVNKAGLPIDMPAGPSEVLVFADETADPEYIAADLLSQAEHGVDSQVVLIGFNEALIKAVDQAIQSQLESLPRAEIARAALENSVSIVVKDRQEALDMINLYAPEHLILSIKDADGFGEKVINAGSVFLGNYTPESVGDYASGTNHTLPTNGFARSYSGVSLDAFVKKITFQRLSKDGLRRLGPVVEQMATAEELMAHKEAVSIRLKKM